MGDNVIDLCEQFITIKEENERLQKENERLSAEVRRLCKNHACDSCGYLTGELRQGAYINLNVYDLSMH